MHSDGGKLVSAGGVTTYRFLRKRCWPYIYKPFPNPAFLQLNDWEFPIVAATFIAIGEKLLLSLGFTYYHPSLAPFAFVDCIVNGFVH
jgi:hypothetical protein